MSALTKEDRSLIENAVDKFIREHYAFEEREQRHQQQGRFGAHWATFAELGWLMLPFAEQAGGMGGDLVDAQVLARAFGRGLIDEPWTEAMVAGKLLEQVGSQEGLLAALVSGEQVFLLAHGEAKADMDFSAVSSSAEPHADGFQLNGTKRVVWQAGAADQFLVTVLLEDEPAVLLVDANAEGLELKHYITIDNRQAADIQFTDVSVSQDALICRGDEALAAVKQANMFAIGALLGEMRGIADQMIALTGDYLNTRQQFGTAIVSFQALQHLLADMVIAKEEIQALEWMMAELASLDDVAERERVAHAAKARAGIVGRKLCETGVQLHGGIGLTDEYVVSHYLRRMVAIDACLGDSQQQLLWLARQY